MRKFDEEFLLKRGREVFSNSKTYRQPIEDEWVDELKLYNSKFASSESEYSEYIGAKRLFIPKTYTNTQRIVVEVLDSILFDTSEIVSISSNKSVSYENQLAVKTLINYRLNGHPISFYHEAYEAILDAVRNKVGIFKVYPLLETKKVKKSNMIERGDQMIEVTYEDEEIINYSPRLEAIPVEDVFFHPRSTWKDYHQYPIIYRYIRTKDQLKRLGYKNLDRISDINLDMNEVNRYRLGDSIFQSPFRDSSVKELDRVYVYEVWDLLPVGENDRLESVWYILIGDLDSPVTVGRDVEINPLPFRFDPFEYNRPPFILGLAYPESHRLYGMSFPKITESLQKETNAQRNQEREAVARALRPLIYVNREAEVDLMALVNRRIGGFVQGNGSAADAITELPIQNPLMVTQGQQLRNDADYYEAGIPPNLLGVQGQDQTATGSTQQLINANKKLSLVIKSLGFTLFLPAFRYLLRLEQFYCSDEFINDVTGRMLGWRVPADLYPPRKLIEGDYDFEINFGMSRENQLNRWMMVLDRANMANQVAMSLLAAGVIQPQNVQFFNSMWMFDRLFNLMGLKNEGEYKIPSIPPPPPSERKGKQELLGVSPLPASPGMNTVEAARVEGIPEYGRGSEIVG